MRKILASLDEIAGSLNASYWWGNVCIFHAFLATCHSLLKTCFLELSRPFSSHRHFKFCASIVLIFCECIKFKTSITARMISPIQSLDSWCLHYYHHQGFVISNFSKSFKPFGCMIRLVLQLPTLIYGYHNIFINILQTVDFSAVKIHQALRKKCKVSSLVVCKLNKLTRLF